MANEIADRIAFFLKDFPPFNLLDYQQMEELAATVRVRYLVKGEQLFAEGDEGLGHCFVLRQGSVRLTRKEGEATSLVDECEAGDILGVRSVLTGHPYVLTAACREESLAYEIQRAEFLALIESHPGFARFFALGYAAGQAIVRDRTAPASLSLATADEQKVGFSQDVLTCAEDESILEAALKMKERNVGSIIATNAVGQPMGIVTDTDLRNKVVALQRSSADAVRSIMSSPVVTIAPAFTYNELVIKMMRRRVHHLVVTRDGTPESAVLGVVSNHDALLSQDNKPAALVKSLRKSRDPSDWPDLRHRAEVQVADFIEKDLDVSLISNFITEINDQLIENAIQMALVAIPEAAKIPFCWLSLGSEGREEQLLRTDQDNALVFESKGPLEAEQRIMLQLGTYVNDVLMKSGFEECPAQIMARNPDYCQDLTGWDRYFSRWIRTPEPKALMNATIFFDFRAVYGDKRLESQLKDRLLANLEGQEIFFNHLAANAIQNPPPLGFFRQFMVEKDGAHEKEFDIKKRAMMPLSDAARVLSLQYKQVHAQNTPLRFRKLAAINTANAQLYEECAQAYEVLMKIRSKYGLRNHDSGRFVEVQSMNKLEKQMLKSAFIPIKDIQQLLEVRFQLAYFR